MKASPLGLPSFEKVKHTPFTFPTISQSARPEKDNQEFGLADSGREDNDNYTL